MDEEFKVFLSSVYGELANPNTLKFHILENWVDKNRKVFNNFKEEYINFIKKNEIEINQMVIDTLMEDKILYDTPTWSIRAMERKPIFLRPGMIYLNPDFSLTILQPKVGDQIQNEYRKFIDENKYGRITVRNRQISIPRIQSTKSNGNNIKYAPRRFSDGVGK